MGAAAGHKGNPMQSMDWDKLRVFYVTAESGSFTKAGEHLHLSQSAVSRQISTLEDRIGVALFHRHARGLLLTEQGEILFRLARDFYQKVEIVEGRLRDSKESPSGTLRITTTIAFGSVWLSRHIGDFIRAYPDIDVQLMVSDFDVDIAMREADVSIRFQPPHQPDLIQRAITDVHFNIYGSSTYLDRKGEPESLDDLANHDLITFGPDAPPSVRAVDWIAQDENGQLRYRPILQINSIYGLLQGVESGLGLAGLPEYFGITNPRLVRVLPDIVGPKHTLYMAYPEELRDSKRVSVFRDFLLKNVGTIAAQ